MLCEEFPYAWQQLEWRIGLKVSDALREVLSILQNENRRHLPVWRL